MTTIMKRIQIILKFCRDSIAVAVSPSSSRRPRR
jgi:hypothetical protein